MHPTLDVAVVSSKQLRDLNEDDRLLIDALRARGLRSRAVAWRGQRVNWPGVGVAVVRSTWDYSTRLPEFLHWARDVSRVSTLVNGLDVVRWNTDKRYLLELQNRGFPVVPTHVFARGSTANLDEVLCRMEWPEGVIKPVVSAAARDTWRVSRGDPGSQKRFSDLLRRQAMMVQPFLAHILDDGEVSLMFINGSYTHAVRKRARPGDYRVQDDHGGTVHDFDPSPDLIARAQDIVRAVPAEPLYARVDLARDSSDEYLLMELEVVEPEMFLRYSAASIQAFCDALVVRL